MRSVGGFVVSSDDKGRFDGFAAGRAPEEGELFAIRACVELAHLVSLVSGGNVISRVENLTFFVRFWVFLVLRMTTRSAGRRWVCDKTTSVLNFCRIRMEFSLNTSR